MSKSRLILSPQMAVTVGLGDFQVIGSATTSEQITIVDNTIVTLTGDFSRGGDLIRLAGRAQDFNAVRSGSNVLLASSIDRITVTVPVGVAGTVVAFDDGLGGYTDTRRLLFDGTNVVLGALPINATPTTLPPSLSSPIQPGPNLSTDTTARARLLVASGQSVAVGGGHFDIIGTNEGSETVIALDTASINLSGDFSRGDDVVRLAGKAGNFTAQLSGSSLVLTSALDAITARIPIGPAGIRVQFEGPSPESFNERVLRFDGRNVTLGDVMVSSAIISLNSAPTVTVPIADQTLQPGRRWEYQIPINSFADRDSDALLLTARLADGRALPAWLTFDPATGRFSGDVPAGQSAPVEIAITVSDGSAAVTDRFFLQVQPGDVSVAPPRPIVSQVEPLAGEFATVANILLGKQWGTPGQPLTITFGFPTSASQYPADPGWTILGGNLLDGFRAFTDEEAALARQALQTWADVANVTFVELPRERAGEAVLRFAVTSTGIRSTEAALAFVPDTNVGAGSTWYSSAIWDLPLPGTGQFRAMVHEIGHALVGLADISLLRNQGSFPADFDQYFWSIMSYDLPILSFNRSPMVLDIVAAQHMFGANSNFKADDTNWSFDIGHILTDGSLPSGRIAELREQKNIYATIWDAGGNDWLDWSNQLLPARINLTPGSVSLMLRPQEWLNLRTFTPSEGNIAIAYGAWLENARGGPAHDVIIGNRLSNRIAGGPGSDTIDGGEGTDTALYEGEQGRYYVSRLQDTYLVEDTATGSIDRLNNVELIQFGNATPTELAPLVRRSGDNTAPRAGRDIVLLESLSRSISLINLLLNDQDAERDGLRIGGVTASGPVTATLQGDHLRLSTQPGASGQARIDYELIDDRGLRSTGVLDVFLGLRPAPDVTELTQNLVDTSLLFGLVTFSNTINRYVVRTAAGITTIDPVTRQTSLLEAASDVIFAVSANGRFIALNAVGKTIEFIDLVENKKSSAPFTGVPIFVSNDGKTIAFGTNRQLTSSDTDSLTDVYVWNADSGPIRQILPQFAGDIIGTEISNDGTKWLINVVTEARNDRNLAYPVSNIYLYDTLTDQAKLLTPTGNPQISGSVSLVDMTPDARFIAFWSSFAFDGVNGPAFPGFILDTQSGTYRRLGIEGVIFPGDGIAISDDGRFVTFNHYSDGLVASDRNGFSDVFVFDTRNNRLEIVSLDRTGGPLNGHSIRPQFVNGGRDILFSSEATNVLSTDLDNKRDIFIVSNPLFASANAPPTATDIAVAPSSRAVEVPISTLLASGRDADGDRLSFVSFGNEGGARVERVGDNLLITPTSSTGVWNVDYVLSDGRGGFATAQITPRLPKLLLQDWSTTIEGGQSQVMAWLSEPATTDIEFRFRLEGVTAEIGQDLRALSDTVIIPAGQNQVRLPIEFLADNRSEGRETFVVYVYEIKGATMLLDSNYGFVSGYIADQSPLIG